MTDNTTSTTTNIHAEKLLKQRSMYLREDGLLFVQLFKKDYAILKIIRAELESRGSVFYVYENPKHAVISGKIVDITTTGMVLDEWKVIQ